MAAISPRPIARMFHAIVGSYEPSLKDPLEPRMSHIPVNVIMTIAAITM